jgi:ribosomal protein S18
MVSKQQKTSPISINQKIDYKDIDLLTLFVTEQGKFFLGATV